MIETNKINRCMRLADGPRKFSLEATRSQESTKQSALFRMGLVGTAMFED